MERADTSIFRAMKATPSNTPLCEDSARGLGVRVPTDIRPDHQGNVHPASGGMSVSPDDPHHLPVSLRPASLKGYGKNPVFWLLTRGLGERLQFRRDPMKPDYHGYVEPACSMQLGAYRAALCETAPRWRILP